MSTPDIEELLRKFYGGSDDLDDLDDLDDMLGGDDDDFVPLPAGIGNMIRHGQATGTPYIPVPGTFPFNQVHFAFEFPITVAQIKPGDTNIVIRWAERGDRGKYIEQFLATVTGAGISQDNENKAEILTLKYVPFGKSEPNEGKWNLTFLKQQSNPLHVVHRHYWNPVMDLDAYKSITWRDFFDGDLFSSEGVYKFADTVTAFHQASNTMVGTGDELWTSIASIGLMDMLIANCLIYRLDVDAPRLQQEVGDQQGDSEDIPDMPGAPGESSGGGGGQAEGGDEGDSPNGSGEPGSFTDAEKPDKPEVIESDQSDIDKIPPMPGGPGTTNVTGLFVSEHTDANSGWWTSDK